MNLDAAAWTVTRASGGSDPARRSQQPVQFRPASTNQEEQ